MENFYSKKLIDVLKEMTEEKYDSASLLKIIKSELD